MKIIIDGYEVEIKSARNIYTHKRATKNDLKDFLTALIVDYIDARDHADALGYNGIKGTYQANIKELRDARDGLEV